MRWFPKFGKHSKHWNIKNPVEDNETNLQFPEHWIVCVLRLFVRNLSKTSMIPSPWKFSIWYSQIELSIILFWNLNIIAMKGINGYLIFFCMSDTAYGAISIRRHLRPRVMVLHGNSLPPRRNKSLLILIELSWEALFVHRKISLVRYC